jgi:hypothetical protein
MTGSPPRRGKRSDHDRRRPPISTQPSPNWIEVRGVVEIVSENEEGFVIVASEDLALNLSLQKINDFAGADH